MLMLILLLPLDGTPVEGGNNSGSTRDIKKKWWIWCIIGLIFSVAVLFCYLCYIKKTKLRLMQSTGKYVEPHNTLFQLILNCMYR